MIKQISQGIFLGLFTSLFFIQFDPWVHKKIGDLFVHILADTFHCAVSGEVVSLSLFPASMTIKNLSLVSKNKQNDWSWCAKKYTTGFSWIYLLFAGAIDMWIVLDNVQALSGTSGGKLSILSHIKDLLKGPDLPIPLFLKSVHMRNAAVTIDNGLHNTFYWNGESRRIGTQFRSQFYVYDGLVMKDQTALVKNISGTIGIDAVEEEKNVAVTIKVDGRGEMPQLGDYPTCFITGRWFKDCGRFQIHSIDHALRINPLIISERNDTLHIDTTMTAPISYWAQLFLPFDPHLKGNALVQMRGSLHPEGNGEAHVICDHMTHDWMSQGAFVRGSFVKRGLQVDGNWDIRSALLYALHGTLSWNGQKENMTCHLVNTIPVAMPHAMWTIQPRAMEGTITYDKQKQEVKSSISCTAFNNKGESFVVEGKGIIDKEQHLVGKASIGNYRFMIDAWNDTVPRITYMGLFDKQDKPLLQCQYHATQEQHTGALDIALLRLLGETCFQYDMQAEGMLLFEGKLKEQSIYADMHLQDATLRLPQTLNFMHKGTASCVIDLASKRITLHDMHCLLHSGSIYIPAATVWLDKYGVLQFAHVPCIIDHCLFSIKHDLFAIISGALVVQKQPNSIAKISGNIILERSQLKENLFSESVQKKLLSSSEASRVLLPLPLICDITLETKDPIRIDTNFLQANAHAFLQIKDEIHNPTIAGIISVPSGSIKFPYKPLHLTKGEIRFLPEQPFNPLVELVAKNNIKNHNVSLHVTGSLQDHMVILESTPPLTEEQIIGLLIAGANEESLQAIIPSLLMKNITNYIFSSHKSNFFDCYIKPWMKQINVHLVPNFNEQSGRGGLRGALEITVNERWRALIEKNFTLTEDTRFELEYILSDDVTFRMIRDERCDVGAEVEMRWKF